MVSAIIALGGNVGDVRTTFKLAILDICSLAQARLLARSSDYATPPWGEEKQPPFVNACIEIETNLAPDALLAVLQTVERTFGRDRPKEQRWGPRTLDLDLIAYDDLTLQTEALTLPHPRVLERAFVLVPLAEIAPGRKIGGRDVKATLANLSSAGIERLPALD
jgi:2-amino-4-hydroxy-6-hydroxymethyldihydropteridine diphosphokinase